MPIKLDYDISREQFKKALDLARSGGALPQRWLVGTRKVGQSPSKTFVAMLGTALLAKATDSEVDPFALKTRDFPTAYSARSLCKDVLVPCAVEAQVHLGTTGREPLNNQPFFRHESVGPDMMVHTSARIHLDYLCECLGAMKRLSQSQALEALAAFIRVRLKEGAHEVAPLRVERALGVPQLIKQVSGFIAEDPESGKRGQALVAACLDLIFKDVRTTRVFDPSRHWPGDVVVFDKGKIALAVEVKQRSASETEIVQFTERCGEMGVYRALAAALHPDQEPLHVHALCEEAWRRHRVHLSVLEGGGNVLYSALTWTSRSLEEALDSFPRRMTKRLKDLEVSAKGQTRWAALFTRSS